MKANVLEEKKVTCPICRKSIYRVIRRGVLVENEDKVVNYCSCSYCGAAFEFYIDKLGNINPSVK